jgi:hypothetical protein
VRVAFKEWAVVVDALSRGDQIIVLRRGGISEDPGGFTIEHERFLLYPTLFHQQRELVQRGAQDRYDLIAPRLSPSQVSIECMVEMADWKPITSAAAALALRNQHVWRDEVIMERLERAGEGSLYAMAVRVFRLPLPVVLPIQPHYGGCRSWVELDVDVDVRGAQPVLGDRDFAAKLQQFEEILVRPETQTTHV